MPEGTPLIADGGLATELEARGQDLSDALWSARLLVDAPQEVTAVHMSFFRAGAMIATTASYQASFDAFAARGIGREETVRLLRHSVELASNARTEVGVAEAWVAASVGPYGALLADGSEYRGRYGLSVAQLEDWHRPRLEVLADDVRPRTHALTMSHPIWASGAARAPKLNASAELAFPSSARLAIP